MDLATATKRTDPEQLHPLVMIVKEPYHHDLVIIHLVETTARSPSNLQRIRDTFPLTEEQQSLKMDPWLVYLIVMALCAMPGCNIGAQRHNAIGRQAKTEVAEATPRHSMTHCTTHPGFDSGRIANRLAKG